MKQVDLGCLTEHHLQLFGAIIQWFARYEWLMQELIATVAGSDSGSVMLLMRSLDFSGKRQALFDLLRHRGVPLDRYDRINAYLMVPYTFTPLRDEIAHSTWIPARSPASIQPDWILRVPPSIRPFRGDGLVKREDDKVNYSVQELSETVDTLAANYELFFAYVKEIGLVSG